MSIGIGLGSFMSSFNNGYRTGRQMKADRVADKKQKAWEYLNTQGKQQFEQGVQSGTYQPDEFQKYWNDTVVPKQIRHFTQEGNYSAAQGLKQYSDSEEARSNLQNFKKFTGLAMAGDHNGMSDWILSAAGKLGYQGTKELINDENGKPSMYRFTMKGSDGSPIVQDIKIGDLAQFGSTYGNPLATWQMRQQQALQQQQRAEKREDQAYLLDIKERNKQNAKTKPFSLDDAYKRMAATDPDFMTLPEAEKRKRAADYQGFINNSVSGQGSGTVPGISKEGLDISNGSVIVKDGQVVPIDKRSDEERAADQQRQQQRDALMAMPAPQDAKALAETATKLESMGYGSRVKAYLYATYRGKDAMALPREQRDMKGLTSEERTMVDAITASNDEGKKTKQGYQRAKETRQMEADNKAVQQRKIDRAFDMWSSHSYTERQIAGMLAEESIDLDTLPEGMRERIKQADKANKRYLFKSDEEKQQDRQEMASRNQQAVRPYALSDSNEELAQRVLARPPQNEKQARQQQNERLVIQLINDKQVPSWAIWEAMRNQKRFDLSHASPEIKIMLRRYETEEQANHSPPDRKTNYAALIAETERRLAGGKGQGRMNGGNTAPGIGFVPAPASR